MKSIKFLQNPRRMTENLKRRLHLLMWRIKRNPSRNLRKNQRRSRKKCRMINRPPNRLLGNKAPIRSRIELKTMLQKWYIRWSNLHKRQNRAQRLMLKRISLLKSRTSVLSEAKTGRSKRERPIKMKPKRKRNQWNYQKKRWRWKRRCRKKWQLMFLKIFLAHPQTELTLLGS